MAFTSEQVHSQNALSKWQAITRPGSTVPQLIDLAGRPVVVIFELTGVLSNVGPESSRNQVGPINLMPGAAEAIAQLNEAGIRVAIVSGTKLNIRNQADIRRVTDYAEALGFRDGTLHVGCMLNDQYKDVPTASEISRWDALLETNQLIFAGVNAEQKACIVHNFKRLSYFVVAVGDGANDELMLKHCDYGIAPLMTLHEKTKAVVDAHVMSEDVRHIAGLILSFGTAISGISRFARRAAVVCFNAQWYTACLPRTSPLGANTQNFRQSRAAP